MADGNGRFVAYWSLGRVPQFDAPPALKEDEWWLVCGRRRVVVSAWSSVDAFLPRRTAMAAL